MMVAWKAVDSWILVASFVVFHCIGVSLAVENGMLAIS